LGAKELYIFPEALLVERLLFFKAAFQSGSTDKSIDLAEDDPAAFSYVINMVFGEGWKISAKLEGVDAQLKLANAYIVADKMGRPDLASSISEDYQCLFYNEGSFDGYLVCGRAAKLAYEKTSESAPIRAVMVEMAAHQYNHFQCFNYKEIENLSKAIMCHPKFHVAVVICIKQASLLRTRFRCNCNLPSCKVHTMKLLGNGGHGD
jgi:hypothetical protein